MFGIRRSAGVIKGVTVRRSGFGEVMFRASLPKTLDGKELNSGSSLLVDSFSLSEFILEFLSAIALVSFAVTAGIVSIAAVPVEYRIINSDCLIWSG